MTATIETPAPPGRHRDVAPEAADRSFLDRLHALEVTAVRLAGEREDALAQARRDAAEAAGQFRVNLELQRHLDEYNQDRRGYEQTIADLQAEIKQLRGADTLELPQYVETRRGWRRSR